MRLLKYGLGLDKWTKVPHLSREDFLFIFEYVGKHILGYEENTILQPWKGPDNEVIYEPEWSIPKKIETIATKMYGAARINYTRQARKDIELLNELGYDKLHVIIAKTPNSLSDDPKALGRPQNFDVDVDRIFLSAGAGFVVAVCGEIMLMPGLPKNPAAESIDIDAQGNITGLF